MLIHISFYASDHITGFEATTMSKKLEEVTAVYEIKRSFPDDQKVEEDHVHVSKKVICKNSLLDMGTQTR